MSLHSPILSETVREYIVQHSVKEHPVQTKIRFENASHPEAHIQITPEQAQLISMILKLINAKKVIELGVFLGYSTLALASAIPATEKVIACEIDHENAMKAQSYWKQAGLAEKIELRMGPALNTLNQLIADGFSDQFDFIFIDADKENYDEYYELSLKLVRKGGLIAIDNVLWYGRVLDATDNSNITTILKQLNEKLGKDERVDINIIPIGDGMSLAMKK